jgi:hypothetical protein
MNKEIVFVKFSPSTNPKKKLMAQFFDKEGKKKKTTHFGSSPNKDFTIYSKESKDIAKTERNKYIARHKVRENWTQSGMTTAGALSRYVLWEKPTVEGGKRAYAKQYGLKIKK